MKNYSIHLLLIVTSAIVFTTCDDDAPALPTKEDKFIYADNHEDEIFKCSLKGPKNVKSLVTQRKLGDFAGSISDLFYDERRKIYYISQRVENRIIKIAYGKATLIYDSDVAQQPRAITVDTKTGDLYWVNSSTGKIMKGTIDGDEPTIIASNVRLCFDIYLQEFEKIKYLYYSEFSTNQNNQGIWELKLETNAVPTKMFGGEIRSFVIDFKGLNVYYSIGNDIFNAPLDQGSVGVNIFTADYTAQALTLDKKNNILYWNERGNENDPDPSNLVAYGSLTDGSGERHIALENIFTVSLNLINE